MAIDVACPRCQQHTAFNQELLWKTVACPACGCRFIAEPAAELPGSGSPKTPTRDAASAARPRAATAPTRDAGVPVDRRPARQSLSQWALVAFAAAAAVAVITLVVLMVTRLPPGESNGTGDLPAITEPVSARQPGAASAVEAKLPEPPVLPASVNVVASPKADERLFLLRLLERMYERWPIDAANAADFTVAAADLRQQAIKYRQHALDSGLDEELPGLYSDFLAALDAYVHFLVAIERIEQSTLTQAQQDSFDSGYSAGRAGGLTFGAMTAGDYSSSEAAGAAAIVGMIGYALESWQRSEARDFAKEQLVAEEARKTSDKVDEALLRAQNLSLTLAERYGWAKGEVGFDLSNERAALVAGLIERDDFKGLLLVAKEQAALRPRDPFVRLSEGIFAALEKHAERSVLIESAKKCLEAAKWVPEPAVYDPFRFQCVEMAAVIASAARDEEMLSGVEPFGSTATGRFAVELWRKLREYEPGDPAGECREGLAFALMRVNRLDEAKRLAAEIGPLRNSSDAYRYNLACLRSRTGDLTAALSDLRQAIRGGAIEIQFVKQDANLLALRRDRKRELDELTSVKWHWSIAWGLLNDDIVVTNDSAFPLTQVVVNARLEQDGKAWSPRLTADVIGLGETHTWKNAVSIPGGRITGSSARLSCDQNRNEAPGR